MQTRSAISIMEVEDTQSSSGYSSGPPWLFKGSALYQLHLVKANLARSFIPKELKLVEAFGYTVGGLFLAQYDDSPAGAFDELVIIPGIVWNPPTSCAWAAKVLVSSQEACIHGRKEVGLPSNVAIFSKRSIRNIAAISQPHGFWNIPLIGSISNSQVEHAEIEVNEISDSSTTTLCNISMPFAESKSNREWKGPSIRMSLPSFSGKTKYNPHLLKYSCQIECRVQRVEPAKISNPTKDVLDKFSENQRSPSDIDGISAESDTDNKCISVLLSKPILALKFNFLKMNVGAPSVVIHHPGEAKEKNPGC